jgi:hypothetical protein
MRVSGRRVGFNRGMHRQPEQHDASSPNTRLDHARARLEAAVDADDEGRLSALEELHSALQAELDAAEAPSPGR